MLGGNQGMTLAAMDGEPCSVELLPSLCSALQESIKVLVLVADVAEPEFDAGAIALEGSLGGEGLALAAGEAHNVGHLPCWICGAFLNHIASSK